MTSVVNNHLHFCYILRPHARQRRGSQFSRPASLINLGKRRHISLHNPLRGWKPGSRHGAADDGVVTKNVLTLTKMLYFA